MYIHIQKAQLSVLEVGTNHNWSRKIFYTDFRHDLSSSLIDAHSSKASGYIPIIGARWET